MLVDSERVTEPQQHQKRHKPRRKRGLSLFREALGWLPHLRDARSQTASMGDTGFEQTRSCSEKSMISSRDDANRDAQTQDLVADESVRVAAGALGAQIVGSGFRPEWISIVKALVELEPQALRAFAAVIAALSSQKDPSGA
jgi:hypothetical protein